VRKNWLKNSHPFRKKCQKTAGGIFLTHTVYCSYYVGIKKNSWVSSMWIFWNPQTSWPFCSYFGRFL